ncbi:hypothetical protein ALC56_15316, partial [Trachymyrmex septentrionalis]
DTKKIVLDVFRPAQCALKVNKIAYAPNKGIRIEANKPDLAKLKSCLELANARLKVMENIKVNPRIIKFMHGMPSKMTSNEIKTKVIVQNLEEVVDLKVTYI